MSIVPTDASSAQSRQLDLWPSGTGLEEDPNYLSDQLITYIGNKRTLLDHISSAIAQVKHRMGKKRLRCFDVFSGSGVVSRLLKAHSSLLVSNDLEDYAAVASRCYLQNASSIDLPALAEIVAHLNREVLSAPFEKGFIEEMYSPRDESNITGADRVFYTKSNARRLDNYRRLLDSVPAVRDFLLGPLLSEASIHANTAGVFKGFYKNRHTQIGQFGGSGSDALSRITGDITLSVPVLSRFECDFQVLCEDANTAARKVRNMDLAYIDPPYNQHPYGSNYFMLNLLVNYRKPEVVSNVSGIPADWKRSGYNSRSKSKELMLDLLQTVDASFLLLSYNNEGFITPEEMHALLESLGRVEVVRLKYNAFRGSRSFKTRSIHTTEHLFLVNRR